MKFRLAIACCTLILAMPAAAQVEKPTGTRIGRPAPAYIPPNTRLADEDRARITTNDFARCVVQGDRKLVVDALAAPVDDPEANAKLARVRFSDCLADGKLHMPPPILRGAFFRALYLQEFDKREWRLADVPTDYGRFAVNKAQPAAASYFSMMAFADCLVRKDLAIRRSWSCRCRAASRRRRRWPPWFRRWDRACSTACRLNSPARCCRQ